MTNNAVPYLRQEYENQKTLFEIQPVIVQHFLDGQAQFIAEALITKQARVRFSLTDRVVATLSQVGRAGTITIPESARRIKVGGLLQSDVREPLMQCLNEMEKSADQGIAVSAGLLRFAAAVHMIHDLLPAGRTVTYRPCDDELIPTIPVEDDAPEDRASHEGS